MNVLICTSIPLETSSAALNRLTRMRSALATQGVDATLVGSQSRLGKPWAEIDTVAGIAYAYDPVLTQTRRYSRALTIAAQAATFYRRYLPELLNHADAQGVIAYLSQSQMGEAIVDAAHSVNRFVVADMVERFQISSYYLLNGVYFQQNRLCSQTLPKLDGIIGISHGWCDWATQRSIPNVWIPSIADDTTGETPHVTSARSADDPFTITFLGHWIRRELPLVLLRSLQLCIARGLSIRLNVIGNVGKSPRERKAMRFLQRHPELRSHVNFTGYISDADKDRMLSNSDAFVILRPDSRESNLLFPTRLPEYLLAGHPVILSNVGSFRNCFQHRGDVWFVSGENRAEDVADAIAQLIADPNERMKIGRAGRETALHQFSTTVLGDRLANFLQQVSAK